jgi:hypothetical protein
LIVGGLLLQAAGMAWIALMARPGLAYPAMIAPMVLAGAVAGLARPRRRTVTESARPGTESRSLAREAARKSA